MYCYGCSYFYYILWIFLLEDVIYYIWNMRASLQWAWLFNQHWECVCLRYHFNCSKIKWLWSQFAFCMVATHKPKKDTLHCLLEKKEKIGFEIFRNWIVLHCIYFNPDKENKKHPEQIAYICRIKFICQWVHLLYLFASCHFLHVSV